MLRTVSEAFFFKDSDLIEIWLTRRKSNKLNRNKRKKVVPTPLEFVGDAICLSGLTGTKLKSDVIGEYYPFWWNITSGGVSQNHQYYTAIVELNAATGEVYIEDTKETVLGSAGHALDLKVRNHPRTRYLKVVLIEENDECYAHLKEVIRRRWPSVPIREAEGPADSNSSNIYLLNVSIDEALEEVEKIDLRNSLFFFDPLRSVEYASIGNVARRRMKTFYSTGTEFFVFIFTSDWFLGRDDFAPLPCTVDESIWAENEKRTVSEADSLFGDQEWRSYLLNENAIKDKERVLVDLYNDRLRRLFRYVLELPFNPKENQIFHLILCSNYETGVRATRNFYALKTGNPRYSPDNDASFGRFRGLHPEVCTGLGRKRRPLEWKILWRIIGQHEGGVCDYMCSDFAGLERHPIKRQFALSWLADEGYLRVVSVKNVWDSSVIQYKLNWGAVKDRLGVDPPLPLRPVSPEDV